MFHDWDNFFIMTGTASATLIGLLFVIVTLGAELHLPAAEQGIPTFLTPTLAHFGGVLFQALAVLAPWRSAWPIGAMLLVFGGVGLAYQAYVFLMMRRVKFVSLDALDWIPYTGLPVLSSLSLIAGAVGLIAKQAFAPYAIAGGGTLLLFAGIYGAWDLTLWTVRNRGAR
jgi:hypothetical protein